MFFVQKKRMKLCVEMNSRYFDVVPPLIYCCFAKNKELNSRRQITKRARNNEERNIKKRAKTTLLH